jgi:predicted RNase H-like HicB family nuclease
MKEREHLVVIEQDEEGWYVASVPSLPGCQTQAKTMDEARERIREAIQAYVGEDEAPATTVIAIERIVA